MPPLTPLLSQHFLQEVKGRYSGVQVFEAKETPPIPVKRPVLSLESLKVAMSEEQATMKGAFRSVTTLGYDLMVALVTPCGTFRKI
jgi:hypothetical protein